jgi:hypothetical protein
VVAIYANLSYANFIEYDISSEAIPIPKIRKNHRTEFCENLNNGGPQESNLTLYRMPIYRLFYTLHVLHEPRWRSRYSVWLRAGRPKGRISSHARVKNIRFSISSRSAPGSTQLPVDTGASSPGKSGRDVKLTTYLQLVPRSRKPGSIHPLPHTSSWCSA